MPQTYSLDPYLQKIQEQSNVLKNAATERDAGVTKLKTESGYNDKQASLDTATRTLYETQKRLDALPEAVNQRTAGRSSNITQAQMDRIIANESNPLAKQAQSMALSKQESQGSLDRVNQAIKDYIGQYNTDLSNRVTGLGSEADAYFKQYQTGTEAQRYAEEMAFKKDMARIQQQQAANELLLRQRQLDAQLKAQDKAKADETKGMTSAYIMDQQDRAANYAIAAGAKPGSADYKKIYTEYLKNSLYNNEPQYGDLGLDMNTIYKTRGALDNELAAMDAANKVTATQTQPQQSNNNTGKGNAYEALYKLLGINK